jgi:hypothetical protein
VLGRAPAHGAPRRPARCWSAVAAPSRTAVRAATPGP